MIQSPYKFQAVFKEGTTPVVCWKEITPGAVTGMVIWQGSVFLEAASNIPSFIRYENVCDE